MNKNSQMQSHRLYREWRQRQAVFRIRIHLIRIPDPIQNQGFDDQKMKKKFTNEKNEVYI
jgi:hypothetical protein